jgi:hypothetical protein
LQNIVQKGYALLYTAVYFVGMSNLTNFIRSDATTDPLAASPLMARVPIHIDKTVRALPNRSAWLRRVITEAAERELMKVAPEPNRRDGGP